ncbi:MAG TPA: zf-HC2 domain-containing protein [Gemmatimonadales bacterium]|nr:zf-HC2 domain-containing protein [Gemmatimonadales bacterium]
MRHVDEGTLHELLDGSLDPTETARVEAHLATCGGCRTRLDDARALIRDTADLILALDTPAAPPSPPRASLLHRRRWITAFGWAASITIAVGTGFALHGPAGAVGTPAAVAGAAAPPPSAVRGTAANRVVVSRRKAVPRPGSATTRNVTAAPNVADKAAVGLAAAPKPESAPPSAPVPLRMHPNAAVALDAPAETWAQRPDSNSITLDEAVRRLGGSIRLIDGLDPVSVARVPGSMVDGADPHRDAVVVRYLDRRLGAIQLAQQRILAADSLDAFTPTPTERAPFPPTTDAPTGRTQEALASVSWRDGHGFQMTLSAAVPVESLAALRARVH